MTSQTGKNAIAIHLLPDISTSKGNQIIKFSQLIENHTQNVVEKMFPYLFLNNQNWI